MSDLVMGFDVSFYLYNLEGTFNLWKTLTSQILQNEKDNAQSHVEQYAIFLQVIANHLLAGLLCKRPRLTLPDLFHQFTLNGPIESTILFIVRELLYLRLSMQFQLSHSLDTVITRIINFSTYPVNCPITCAFLSAHLPQREHCRPFDWVSDKAWLEVDWPVQY